MAQGKILPYMDKTRPVLFAIEWAKGLGFFHRTYPQLSELSTHIYFWDIPFRSTYTIHPSLVPKPR